ncbi:MAG TPA: hypothetical protein VN579_08695, partial [Bryobacteraceae bacterium]|nr:hypothetical protein [Bryobacteraceae bacterium]
MTRAKKWVPAQAIGASSTFFSTDGPGYGTDLHRRRGNLFARFIHKASAPQKDEIFHRGRPATL